MPRRPSTSSKATASPGSVTTTWRWGPGDIVFVPTDAYHGFYNTSETERAVMVWCYGGAGTLAEAGYVREGADSEPAEAS